jgi:hypothetical protein
VTNTARQFHGPQHIRERVGNPFLVLPYHEHNEALVQFSLMGPSLAAKPVDPRRDFLLPTTKRDAERSSLSPSPFIADTRRAAAQETLDGRHAEVTTCATGAIPKSPFAAA